VSYSPTPSWLGWSIANTASIDNFKIECPTGSARMMNLFEVAHEIANRLERIFLRDKSGPTTGVLCEIVLRSGRNAKGDTKNVAPAFVGRSVSTGLDALAGTAHRRGH
jgi:hypothetical protein